MALPTSPWRRWRSYGTEFLPTAAEALQKPLRAFPSWFLRIECDRCGKPVMHNEAHLTEHRRSMVLRVLLSRMRHDGCGGRAARVRAVRAISSSRSCLLRMRSSSSTAPISGSIFR